MPENKRFLPEGLRSPQVHTVSSIKHAAETGEILEAAVERCSPEFTLQLSLNGITGVISREEVVAPWISGADRNISVLSTVGKRICFTVKSISADAKGAPIAQLSRRAAQETAMTYFLDHLQPGMILTGRVTHLDTFGAFLDIGCGIIAMLPIEFISISRIPHPRHRFYVGQKILAAVHSIDTKSRRITMTHRELLGTWLENASRFHAGETVCGIVRAIKPYGSFVELSPNLSGLTASQERLSPDDRVSVFIKSIHPDRMKIKLQVIETLPPKDVPDPPQYQITDGQLDHWLYSPPECSKRIETIFTACAL